MARELRKAKVNGAEVYIRYTEPPTKSSAGETITLEGNDPPLKELGEALQALKPHLLHLCSAPKEWAKDITIRSVTISDVGGVVITGLRALPASEAPLVLNSPHMEPTPALDDALGVLAAECWRYVDGERAQLTLALGPVAASG